jgi:hypothetical protein
LPSAKAPSHLIDRPFFVAGQRFKVLAGDVVSTSAVSRSIMPDGLLDRLTDGEIRDLVAYLAARK